MTVPTKKAPSRLVMGLVFVAVLLVGMFSSLLPIPELAVLGVVGAGLLWFILYRPLWGFYLLILVLPLRLLEISPELPVVGFRLMLYRVVIVGLFAAMMIRAPRGWFDRIIAAPMTLPLLAFSTIAFGSVFLAWDKGLWLKYIVQFVMCLGIYTIVIIIVNRWESFVTACRLVAVMGIIYAVWGVVDYIFFLLGLPSNTMPASFDISYLDPPRARGPNADPNIYMMTILPALPLAAVWLSRNNSRHSRWSWYGVVALFLLLIPLSGSRGAAVALVLLFITAGAFAVRRSIVLGDRALERCWLRGGALVAALMLAAGFVIWSFFPLHTLRIERTFAGEGGAGRTRLWQRAIETIPDNPFGRGLGNIREGPTGLYLSTHNAFLEIIGELGLPGIVIYMWLVGVVIRESVRFHRDSRYSPWLVSVALGILTVYYAGFFLSNFMDEVFALLWGLLMAGNRLAMREKNTVETTETSGDTAKEPPDDNSGALLHHA